MKKMISVVLFYGALWGILEATLGYVLQFPFVPFFVSGLVMFPIAMVLLISAYLKTGSKQSLVAIGVIAASIKALNLISPMHYWRTVNPMVSIMIETLVVVGFVTIIVNKPWKQKAMAVTAASISWRLLYMGYMGGQFVTTGFVHNHLSSSLAFVEFVLLQGILSGGIALALYYIIDFLKVRMHTFIPIQFTTASAMLVLAVVLTIYL